MTTDDSYGYATHNVLNQPPALADYDVYDTDPALRLVTKTFGADWADQRHCCAGNWNRQASRFIVFDHRARDC